jgi:CheY-like chemotaxis protein
MAAEPIHILLVEDDPENVRTIWNMLHEKSQSHYFMEAVTGVSEALKRLTPGDMSFSLTYHWSRIKRKQMLFKPF